MISSGVIMEGSYDYRVVVLSVWIAVCAAYAALDFAGRVAAAHGWVRTSWLTGGAITLGFGIWSMHYTGMLAFHLPVPVAYHWPTAFVSLLTGIFSSGVALYLVSQQKIAPLQTLTGGFIMGTGIAGLHYIAMASIRLSALVRYDLRVVTLSVMLAIMFSLIALRLAFHFGNQFKWIFSKKLAGAVLIGAAISIMHYTGMTATSFQPSNEFPDLSYALSFSPLGTAGIVVVTLIVQCLAVLSATVDRRLAAHAMELQASEELAAHVLRSQDEERRRIARQLHETTAQSLVALKMNLEKLNHTDTARDPGVSAVLSDCLQLVEESMKDVRTVSYLLHPPLLDEAGLVPALRWYAAGFGERSGIAVSLEITPDLDRLPPEIEIAVFRIIQESMLNIYHHSGSPTAKIRVARIRNNLLLEVEDKGHGMPGGSRETTQNPVPLGVGIAGMRERVKQLGGRLEIHSDSQGTKITVTLPY